MPDILHATWLPDTQEFFVWGESLTPTPRKGRQSKPPAHPFQSASAALRAQVGEAGSEQTRQLWLPAVGKQPYPSPELLAIGAATPPKAKPQLAVWRVTGLCLPVSPALDFLLALSPTSFVGADLRAWHLAALLAMELLAGQQVMPTLTRDDLQLRATWRPRPLPTTAAKIAALARALPPLCRAVAEDPEAAPGPRALLDNFLAAAVDRAIREMPGERAPRPTTPGGHWLAALRGDDPLLPLKGQEASELHKAWQTWVGQGQVAGDEVFHITFRLEPPAPKKTEWTLAYLLQATDDPSLLVPAAHLWREKGAAFTYLDRRFEQPQERLLKGLGYAARLFPAIDQSLRRAAPDRARLNAAEAFTFLKEAAPLLENSGFGVLVPGWWQGKGARLQARAKVAGPKGKPTSLGLLSFDSLVRFNWELTLNGEPITRAEFDRLVALKQPLVQVRGEWVVLDPAFIENARKFFEQREGELPLAEVLRLGLGGEVKGAAPAGVEVTGVDAEGWLGELLAKLSQAHTAPLETLAPPKGLHGQLRPYQQRGVAWLAFLRQFGLGACLADDMGLGKTIETIAFLLHERETLRVKGPTLIVCPTSVVGNWQRELERFAPALRVSAHRGIERQRGAAFLKSLKKHDVLLTSYPLLARDRATFEEVEWATVVLDEAQNIKNSTTKQAQAARALRAANRIALTGTPVENRLSDLWSLMAFLNPGYLGSETAFRRDFARPIERTADPQAAAQLRQLTAPFILRRLKTDKTIIADLPDKLEMKVYCPLTQEQATLYEAVVREALEQVQSAEEEGDSMQRRGLVLAMLMKLKQVCNHPAHFLKDGSALPNRSGKLARLTEMLEEVCAAGDHALVFTQFAEMGKLLQAHLRETLYEETLFLHGGTPAKERDELVRRFQAPRGPKIFLLSLKAGGTGLNLTAANHVFHFDRWWNPAVENQATDRAFRIGQTRNVQVHKYLCSGTLEDRIDEMIESKKALAESVLGAGETWLSELNTAQLRDLVTLRREFIVEG